MVGLPKLPQWTMILGPPVPLAKSPQTAPPPANLPSPVNLLPVNLLPVNLLLVNLPIAAAQKIYYFLFTMGATFLNDPA